MNSLTKEEKDIILDFYFRCGTDERIDRARDMIASDRRAAALYASLEQTLCQLDNIKYEPCPDNLVDVTVAKLKLAASAERASAQRLKAQIADLASASPQATSVPRERRWWTNIADLAAVAAVFLAVLSLAFPSLGKLRQVAWRNSCEARMASVGAGMATYANDHNGQLPLASSASLAGSPWWKVGDQGKENHSNTRHVWLLVKGDYVPGKSFICPGRKEGRAAAELTREVGKFLDFPAREAISYSFVYMCEKRSKRSLSPNDVILADLNPVFEHIFDEPANLQSDHFGKLEMNDDILSMMSTSHAGKGQNILYGNGSVIFAKERIIGGDDIYTIKGTGVYSGMETPCETGDTFLIP